MSPDAAYIVVDFWRVKPGHEAGLEQELAASATAFRAEPGVLSVDFTHVDDDPGRYLVIFRYDSAATRAAFVSTALVRDALTRLGEFWDLDSPVWRGTPIRT